MGILRNILLGLGLGMLANELSSNASIGKLSDYNSPPSGRVDQYWNGDLKPYFKRLIGFAGVSKNQFKTPEQLSKIYDLQGIEFGNWMNESDRYSHLVATAVSLSDLAKILRVSKKKIGMRGRLAIALGARGKSAAAAHYETGRWTINITKTTGAGSLGHEFGHFIDNYLSYRYLNNRAGYGAGGRSTRKRTNKDEIRKGRGLKFHYESLFDILYFKSNGEKTKFHIDQQQRSKYFNQRNEVFARSFETYLHIKKIERGITNRYLQDGIGGAEPPIHLIKKAMPHMEAIIKLAFK